MLKYSSALQPYPEPSESPFALVIFVDFPITSCYAFHILALFLQRRIVLGETDHFSK
uniref:Uncharacterized protein n=1 Tax=Mesocestoides corti TaxID=53468 RepID=A0A5K3G3F5_MESCO